MLTTKTRRLVLGIFLLLVVDVIWVLSSELTKYLYDNERYDKPFFCTYFKTSLFTIYLLVLGALSPWKETCERNTSYSLVDQSAYNQLGDGETAENGEVATVGGGGLNIGSTCVSIDDDDAGVATNPGILAKSGTAAGNGNCNHNVGSSSSGIYSPTNSLSDSTFVPIKPTHGADDDDDDDDEDAQVIQPSAGSQPKAAAAATSAAAVDSNSSSSEDVSSCKSVRFNRLAEVREMSAAEASEALMARLSWAASLRLRRQRSHHKTARTALLFCILWFLGNYLFQLALETDETAMVTLLSSTSSLFTLVLAAIWPSSAAGDRLTLSKAVAVVASCAGVVLVTVGDGIREAHMSRGIVLALLSALAYAAYLVMVKRKSAREERINIPLFFGFVGLWNLLLLWPVLLVFNFTQIEVFEWPNRQQLALLLLNGVVGTVVSEALWLWACFLTSSLVGTLAFGLQIPLSIAVDVLLKGKEFGWMFYAGAVPQCAALVAVALLLRHDDGDPLLRWLRIVYRKVCHCRPAAVVRIVDLDDEQQESLIDSYEH